MTSYLGMRVLRGPDWEGEDSKGKEAHVGTVTQVLSEHQVQVLWDTGEESTCRTGRDEKFDLRIFDTAQVGVHHPGTVCAVCEEKDIVGMLWRCHECKDCDLCSACYSQDQHVLRHRFLRVDTPCSKGVLVTCRKSSVQIRSLGIFPGAKVMRGKDWIWDEQDGGHGSQGEVEGYENVAPDSYRNILRVRWSNGALNSYRLGYKGHVDLVCVEEDVGPNYYRDHLPLLDTRESSLSGNPPLSSAAMRSSNISAVAGHEDSTRAARTSQISSAASSRTCLASAGDPGHENTAVVQVWATMMASDGVTSQNVRCNENTDLHCSTGVHVTLVAENSKDTEEQVDISTDGNAGFEITCCDDKTSSTESVTCAQRPTWRDTKSAGSDINVTTYQKVMETSPSCTSLAKISAGACDGVKVNVDVIGDEEEEKNKEEIDLNVGDHAAIAVQEDNLEDLQKDFGGCTRNMKQCIGSAGEVVHITKTGSVYVNFKSVGKYRFNPKTLVKVYPVKEGQSVEIRQDLSQVKILNRNVGWNENMVETLGKVGKVVRVDSGGVTLISFGEAQYWYSPACCLPALDATPQVQSLPGSLAGGIVNTVSNGFFNGSNSNAQGKENKAVFQIMRGLVLQERSTSFADPRDQIRSLFAAIEVGDVDRVVRLCGSQRLLLKAEYDRLTPLMAACVHGQLKVVKLFLDLGDNVNQTIGLNRTPLSAAIGSNDDRTKEDICILLIERGADIRFVDSRRQSYMHMAASRGLGNVIRALAARGADVNGKDEELDTPLHKAVQNGNPGAMEALLDVKGIQVRAKNRRDYSALHLASQEGYSRTVQKILALDTGGVNDFYRGSKSPLHLAAGNGHAECIRLLVIEGKANIDLQDHGLQTPLHVACTLVKYETTEALLELGANVNLQDREGHTPLHLIAGSWDENDLESEASQGESQRRVMISCMLISKGAYVDVRDKKGLHPFVCGLIRVREGIREFMKHNKTLVRYKHAPHELDSDYFFFGLASSRQHKQNDVKVGGAPKSEVTLLPRQFRCICSNCSRHMREKLYTGPDDHVVDLH